MVVANNEGKPVAGLNESFYDLSPDKIRIRNQIRSEIDTESEAFLGLTESIREKGVLEPILVTPCDGGYQLISGERRLRACQKLELPNIPARVLDPITAREEILAIQLMENLQREDIDPIDEANALREYCQSRHATMSLYEILSMVYQSNRNESRLAKDVATTVVAIANISGKSNTSLHRAFTLLKLPDDIKASVRKGETPVSQGYIYAANLDNPGLAEIFKSTLEKPLTNAALTNRLAASARVKKDLSGMKPKPFATLYSSMKAIKAKIGKGGTYQKEDLAKLLTTLRTMTTLVEQAYSEKESAGI